MMTFAECSESVAARPWQLLHATVTGSSHSASTSSADAATSPLYFKLHSTPTAYTLVVTNLLHVWYHHAADAASLERERQLYVPQLKKYSDSILRRIFDDSSSPAQHAARMTSTHLYLSSSTTLQQIYEVEWRFDCQLIGTQLQQADFLHQQWTQPMIAICNAAVQSMSQEQLQRAQALIGTSLSATLDCSAVEPLYSTYMVHRVCGSTTAGNDATTDVASQTNHASSQQAEDSSPSDDAAASEVIAETASPQLSAEEQAEQERLHLQEIEEQLKQERLRKRKKSKFA